MAEKRKPVIFILLLLLDAALLTMLLMDARILWLALFIASLYITLSAFLRDGLHRFPSSRYAVDIAVPTLVVASRTDEAVPFASSESLSACIGGEVTFVTLSGVGHNSIFFNRTALNGVKAYLDNIAEELPEEKRLSISRGKRAVIYHQN